MESALCQTTTIIWTYNKTTFVRKNNISEAKTKTKKKKCDIKLLFFFCKSCCNFWLLWVSDLHTVMFEVRFLISFFALPVYLLLFFNLFPVIWNAIFNVSYDSLVVFASLCFFFLNWFVSVAFCCVCILAQMLFQNYQLGYNLVLLTQFLEEMFGFLEQICFHSVATAVICLNNINRAYKKYSPHWIFYLSITDISLSSIYFDLKKYNKNFL